MPELRTWLATMFSVCVLPVAVRYIRVGPEKDTGRTSFRFDDSGLSFDGLNIQDSRSVEAVERICAIVVRQTLPAPAAKLVGPAAEAASVVELSPPEQAQLRAEDESRLSEAVTALRGYTLAAAPRLTGQLTLQEPPAPTTNQSAAPEGGQE